MFTGIGIGMVSQRTATSLQALLFGQNEPGVLFDPTDLTTLYQDRAGTTPVTAAGQSVGLRLSKDQGLRKGPELVTNGTFGANITGWSNTGSSTSIWESGAARWSTATADFSGFRSASFATVVGRTYEFTATVLENTGAAWRIILVNGDGSYSNGTDNYTTPGTRTARFIATQTTSFVEIRNGTAATANRLIDNISVRELAGNHEVAVSDAKRGVYGWMPKTGRRNLLERTEEFGNAYWNTTAVTVVPDQTAAHTGTITADRITKASVAFQSAFRTSITSVASQTYTVSAYFKSDTLTRASIAAISGTTDVRYWFDLSAKTVGGAIGSFTTGYVDSAIEDVGGGWLRFSLTVTAQATQIATYFYPDKADNAVAGSVFVWGAQLEVGSTATAYQRVASQYEITEAGVPTCYYVQADGVDDAYVTPTITPNTDKVQVFAGIRKLSETGVGTFVEFSTAGDVNNGAFYLRAPWEGVGSYDWNSQGTLNSRVGSSGQTAPITNVITGLGDISGDTATLRINGTQVAQSTIDQGTGNYLAYPAYIYARGGTSLPFNGLDFGHAVRFGPNLDAATIARVESLIARNTPEVGFLFGGVWNDGYAWNDNTNWNDGA